MFEDTCYCFRPHFIVGSQKRLNYDKAVAVYPDLNNRFISGAVAELLSDLLV
jgi:hypothetical protein